MSEKRNIYFSSKLQYDNHNELENKSMLAYLESFDPIELKYSILPDRIFYDKSALSKTTISAENRDKIIKYEESFQFGSITKQPYSSIKDNLMLVYGDSDLVKDDIKIFHYTEKKFIHQYIAIPQLDKMFDEDYFNFEWDMHIGQNFAEHRNDYQRDHFIHQIRDMYSMLMLLGRHNFYESTLNIMSDANCSKISQYTCKRLNEFLDNREKSYSFLRKLNIQDLANNSKVDKDFWYTCGKALDYDGSSLTKKAYAKSYFLKYAIYGSTILASLFHDMCYPICHFLGVRNRTSAYNPTMYMFTHNATDSFDHIASLLSSSLLFTIILPEDIKKSLEPGANGYNHGAYSAIAFLLQFYNSGIIFSLPVEKQCAIELAAVAIYDHTLHYNVEKYEKDNYFYQPVFRQNPISFLLRLCDDLQEWDRRYFEISAESDIPICSKCLTPSIADRKKNAIEYNCYCSVKNNSSSISYNSFRNENFKNRKLYLVTTADYMTSKIVKINESAGKKALYFTINYDYYKLLNIARINPTYAKYRLKELNKLKMLQKYHDFKKQSNKDLGFDYIYFDYFMTSNPIAIKIKILEKFLQTSGLMTACVQNPNDSKLLGSIAEIINQTEFNNSVLYKILNNRVFRFYTNLLKIAVYIKDNDNRIKIKVYTEKEKKEFLEDNDKLIRDKTSVIIKRFFKKDKTSSYYRSIMNTLIYDCLLQYSRQFTISNDNSVIEPFIDEEAYYNQYSPEKENYFNNCVTAYCNSENDFNSYDNYENRFSNSYIGYFADLHFFELMNSKIQQKRLEDIIKEQK